MKGEIKIVTQDSEKVKVAQIEASEFGIGKPHVIIVGMVALMAAFIFYVSETGERENQAGLGPPSFNAHQRVDFDMFPGRYLLDAELVDFQLVGGDASIEPILRASLEEVGSGSREFCLSSRNAKYNIFSDGITSNCMLNKNQSFPGVIDVEQSCANPANGSGDMIVRIQGEMTTDDANIIMAANFDVAGAGQAKILLKSTMERIGDCE
jgi:hypothetical protein